MLTKHAAVRPFSLSAARTVLKSTYAAGQFIITSSDTAEQSFSTNILASIGGSTVQRTRRDRAALSRMRRHARPPRIARNCLPRPRPTTVKRHAYAIG